MGHYKKVTYYRLKYNKKLTYTQNNISATVPELFYSAGKNNLCYRDNATTFLSTANSFLTDLSNYNTYRIYLHTNTTIYQTYKTAFDKYFNVSDGVVCIDVNRGDFVKEEFEKEVWVSEGNGSASGSIGTSSSQGSSSSSSGSIGIKKL